MVGTGAITALMCEPPDATRPTSAAQGRHLLHEQAVTLDAPASDNRRSRQRFERAGRLRAYLTHAFHGTDFFVGAPGGQRQPSTHPCGVADILRGAWEDKPCERLAWCGDVPHPETTPSGG